VRGAGAAGTAALRRRADARGLGATCSGGRTARTAPARRAAHPVRSRPPPSATEDTSARLSVRGARAAASRRRSDRTDENVAAVGYFGSYARGGLGRGQRPRSGGRRSGLATPLRAPGCTVRRHRAAGAGGRSGGHRGGGAVVPRAADGPPPMVCAGSEAPAGPESLDLPQRAPLTSTAPGSRALEPLGPPGLPGNRRRLHAAFVPEPRGTLGAAPGSGNVGAPAPAPGGERRRRRGRAPQRRAPCVPSDRREDARPRRMPPRSLRGGTADAAPNAALAAVP
jgi:hypothetical protein